MDDIGRVYLSAMNNRAVSRTVGDGSSRSQPSVLAIAGGRAIYKVTSVVESAGRRLGQLAR